PGRMAVEQVARWPWNAWPDERGLGGRMAWNPQFCMSIKPGPKRTNEDGTPDKRQRVTPEKQKDHPDLKPHKHKKGE
ncbi:MULTISPECIES: hypothetical protein, partial [Pseudomonas]